MFSALNSTLNTAVQALMPDPEAATAQGSAETGSTGSEGGTAAAETTDPDTAAATASRANTQSSLSVAGARAVESSAESTGDLERSRAEAIAAQNRERQGSIAEALSKGGDAAPRLERVEAEPSSKEAATRYAAANTPAAPARAMAEMRA